MNRAFIKLSVSILSIIFISISMFSCTSTDLVIDEIETFYVKDMDDPSIIANVSFHANTENDELLVTLISPDGLLTWEALAIKATDGIKHYFTLPDIVLPYYISGEWNLKVARSDKTVEKKLNFNAPDKTDISIPSWFETTTVSRVNGGVYTISAPYIQRDNNITVSCYNPSTKEMQIVGELKGEREKRISIPFRPSGIVFTSINKDNVVLRHNLDI